VKTSSISLNDQTDLTGTSSTSESTYFYFFSEHTFLLATYFYILPYQSPKTVLRSTIYVSVPTVSRDNPVTEWDPSGKSGLPPTPVFSGQQSGSTKKQLEATCLEEQPNRDRLLEHPIQLHRRIGKVYSCIVSSSDFTNGSIHASLPAWVEVSLLTIAIQTTSGIIVTMQSDVSITGNSNQPISFSLNFYGSFSINSGNSSVNLSSTVAFEELIDKNCEVNPNGVSYTDTISNVIGPYVATADITATVQPMGTAPSDSISPNLKTSIEVVGTSVIFVIIWWGARG
jgi:hypothetical protein